MDEVCTNLITVVRRYRKGHYLSLMKSFYTLLLSLAGLLLSSHSVAQGSLAALEMKKGFRDAKIGMPLSAFEDMRIVKDSPSKSEQVYYRLTDVMSIETLPLANLLYFFKEGRLIKVRITFLDGVSPISIAEILTRYYGKCHNDDGYSKFWVAKSLSLKFCRPDVSIEYTAKNYLSILNSDGL